MTSIHRKLGDLYEQCVQTIFTEQLGLPAQMPRYMAQIVSGNTDQERSIDVYVPFDQVRNQEKPRLLEISDREIQLITKHPRIELTGLGFEVRHCYQSADSKRIQADEAMARHLLLSGILPIMLIFCNQSNRQIVARYTGTWIVKEGMAGYNFVEDLTGFKFYAFLMNKRSEYREIIRKALQRIVD